jgi:hypothetical protein
MRELEHIIIEPLEIFWEERAPLIKLVDHFTDGGIRASNVLARCLEDRSYSQVSQEICERGRVEKW